MFTCMCNKTVTVTKLNSRKRHPPPAPWISKRKARASVYFHPSPFFWINFLWQHKAFKSKLTPPPSLIYDLDNLETMFPVNFVWDFWEVVSMMYSTPKFSVDPHPPKNFFMCKACDVLRVKLAYMERHKLHKQNVNSLLFSF